MIQVFKWFVRNMDLDDLRWIVTGLLVVAASYAADAIWQLEAKVRDLELNQWDGDTVRAELRHRIEDLELDELERAPSRVSWGTGSMVVDRCEPEPPLKALVDGLSLCDHGLAKAFCIDGCWR